MIIGSLLKLRYKSHLKISFAWRHETNYLMVQLSPEHSRQNKQLSGIYFENLKYQNKGCSFTCFCIVFKKNLPHSYILFLGFFSTSMIYACFWFSWIKLVFSIAVNIFGALRDLVLLVQFKKREKHPWSSVNFRKVAG